MRQVFADAAYWIALINPRDNLNTKAKEVSQNLGPVRIYTSEMVLTEVLNGLGGKGTIIRKKASEIVEKVQSNVNVEVVPQTSELFRGALSFYTEREDKEWGLTDCSSFIIMKKHNLTEALTSDHHFAQAGFVPLMQEK